MAPRRFWYVYVMAKLMRTQILIALDLVAVRWVNFASKMGQP